MKLPLFVTVDTEGDNGWNRPKKITTVNAKGVARFQQLCEEFGIKPIYLTNYEMAMDTILVDSLKRKNRDGLCEIGMHMHAWNVPPKYDLTKDDFQFLPFVTEYPEEIINEKVRFLTSILEDKFESEMVSHRSGRWAVNHKYLQVLVNNGYKVDCSHTPLIDWRCSLGNPFGNGGSDYSKSLDTPNIIELEVGSILEIPMTTMKNKTYDNFAVDTIVRLFPKNLKSSKVFNALNGRRVLMLRPDIRREKLQLNLIKDLSKKTTIEHLELMIHSSELYKGTSPHCQNAEDLDRLYSIIRRMFSELCKFSESKTFLEYIANGKK